MSEDFDFGEGAEVRVRVREHGDSGNIEGKFDATVEEFQDYGGLFSDKVRLDPPWESTHGVTLRPYDAEFEVLEEANDGD